MLRPISPQSIGTTDFFRNRAFLSTLVDLLLPIENPRVIFHACSCGAEPLSFAVLWRERHGGRITIHATDIEPLFLSMAKTITHESVTESDRELVTFLTPSNMVTFRADEPYDAVICMNALCYLSEDEQRLAIRALCKSTKQYLCITAASPSLLRQELQRTGFRPLWKSWVRIYYGWRERLSLRHRKCWKLPVIPMLMPAWRYSGTSIFAR